MFSGKEQTSLRKMRDKEFKEGGKKPLLCLEQRMYKTQWKMAK